MASDSQGPQRAQPHARPYVQFTARLARAICLRVAAGETLVAICADPDMPSRKSVERWARDNPRFAKIFHRAKTVAARTDGLGPTTSYCDVVAHEICMRVSEGESLTAICDDPAMPAMWTVMHWQRRSADFAQALAAAKEARAERMADQGWDLALAATPETAHVTRVRLGHLRWRVAIMAPKTHGRRRASEPPAAAEVLEVCFRHFKVETHPETGYQRVVTYTPDPDTNQPVRTDEGPWTAPLDPVAKAHALGLPSATHTARCDDERWL